MELMIDDMRPQPIPRHEPDHQRHTTEHEPDEQSKDDAFQPPSQVAAQDEQNDEEQIDMNVELADKPKKQRRSLKQWLQGLTKKQWIIISVVAAIALVGGGTGVYTLVHKKTPAKTAAIIKKQAPPVPIPTTEPSKLTGLAVVPAVNKRPTTAVMIENSTFARPQSGLDQAGVVFEAIAEGGITRFEAIFQDTTPAYLGPVRSVRPYYIQWAMGFDAAIAHVGGSPEALNDLPSWGAKNLDQFANGNYYQRITSRDAPHNVYTSIAQLNDLEGTKGYGAANYTGFLRKNEQPSKAPTASSIDLNISSSDYNVHYDYVAATNNYKRSEGGAPHMVVDQNGVQTQITPKVVVALSMSQGLEADDHHTSYATIGTGHAYIFQDGIVTEGTWTKNSNAENITFTNGSGKPISLNPGQTWITIAGATSDVSYH
jgi:hypothetical protein